MRVCVVGPGAMGGWIAAWLARAGSEVCLVARGAHLEALRERGLTLISGGGRSNYRLPASGEPRDFGSQDVVFICLKAYSIGPMLPRIAPLLGPQTMVVPAINGLPWWYFYKEGGPLDGEPVDCLDPGGAMLAALDPARIVGCVVHGAGEVTEPGVVLHTAGRRIIVGEPDRSVSERASALTRVMREAGFEATLSADIRVDVWAKLIGNLSYNPVAALTLALMNDLNANEELLDLIRVMMRESMEVAAAYGVQVPVTIEERIAIARQIGNSRVSMHQDIDRGRPLETDAVVKAVMELGRKAGVAMPMTSAVHALVAERARHLDR